jgi:hypothetical protein
MAEPINVKCPSCGQILAAADEGGLVSLLREHLYEEHTLKNAARKGNGERRRPVARFRRLQRSTYQWGLKANSSC